MKIGYAKTLTGKLDSVTQETFIDQYAVEKFYVDKIFQQHQFGCSKTHRYARICKGGRYCHC